LGCIYFRHQFFLLRIRQVFQGGSGGFLRRKAWFVDDLFDALVMNILVPRQTILIKLAGNGGTLLKLDLIFCVGNSFRCFGINVFKRDPMCGSL
jgi:hypothetical protein